MAYDPRAIANYFLDLAKDDPEGLSPMKLQKLVYFAHGWYLAYEDEPLIDAQIEAWEWGPVVEVLFRDFKEFGSGPITRKAYTLKKRAQQSPGEPAYERVEPSIDDDQENVENADFTKEFLKLIWDLYGHYSAARLSNMTHAVGTPWYNVVHEQYGGKVPRSTDIPRNAIRDYFREQRREGEEEARQECHQGSG